MTDWSVLLWIRMNLNTSIREKMESWWILNFRPKTYGVHFFDIRLSIYFEWETSISNFLFTFSTLINAIIREMIETFCLYKGYQCIVQLLYFASHVAWIKPLKPIYIFIVIIVKYVIHKIFKWCVMGWEKELQTRTCLNQGSGSLNFYSNGVWLWKINIPRLFSLAGVNRQFQRFAWHQM